MFLVLVLWTEGSRFRTVCLGMFLGATLQILPQDSFGVS